MVKITFTIYRNQLKPKDGKPITFDKNSQFSSLLTLCSQKLGIKAVRVFKAGGNEIDNIGSIDNDDNLYISEGENYIESDGIKIQRSSELGLAQYKLVILGPASVGKSAITLQYTKGQFVPDYLPTIEDEYTQKLEIDNQLSEVSILDTAGEEEYIACRTAWIKGKDGFVLAFSVDRDDCKKDLDGLFNSIKMIHDNKEVPIVLVANKIDMVEKRKVSSDTVAKWAQEYNIPYYETSAKNNKNITETFTHLVREIKKKRETKKIIKVVKKKSVFDSLCTLI
jgi:small GTP-binding protein